MAYVGELCDGCRAESIEGDGRGGLLAQYWGE